ncbi:hypothetical protein ACFGVR_07355 [Mucilaginibacter sp. AW1-3]
MTISLCTVFLASCGTEKSYHFKTNGVRGDSSYLVTASGRHVDVTNIDVKPGKVTVDGKPYPLDSISSIKTQGMYFGVSNRKLLLGESYGRINLLYELISMPTYGSPGGPGNNIPGSPMYNSIVTGHTTQKRYYIQKSGSTDIDRMTVGTVIDYVADNEEALQVAKGARSWKRGYLLSLTGIAVGSIYGFHNVFSTGTDANGHTKSTSFAAPLAIIIPSIAGATLSSYKYNTQMLKAIEIYNR